jgi:hypothetical protein
MTKEERARLSRENGAKSKGPVTEEGKERSARNAIEHGLRAGKLKHFAPPHYVALANEDRREYYQLLDELVAVYQPVNLVAAGIVRDIAVARWQMLRLDTCITSQWNLALIDQAQKPLTVAPELGEVQVMARSVEAVYGGSGIVHKLNRQIDQLQMRIVRLQRQLKFVHQNFSAGSLKRTQPDPPQPTENTEKEPENETKTEQPVFVTENTPEVIAYYKKLYPNREIVIMPPDDVANGIDVEDDMPDIPRNLT